MQKERIELSERLLNFGAEVIRVTRKLKKDHIDVHIARSVITAKERLRTTKLAGR